VLDIGAILVDFDGTACAVDASEALLEEFGDPTWPEWDEAVDRGEVGLREAATRQASMLTGTRDEMIGFALDHCPLDPTFEPFVGWVEHRGLALTVVSDGFGFYVRPILEAAGLSRLSVMTNDLILDRAGPRLLHPHGNPECVGCGTCKMLAVQRARESGPVVFIGEGQSDRYGALYSDLVFAKDALVEICRADGVRFLPWSDFDDVRRALEGSRELPGPVAPSRCPGWRPP
jgi:2,3-diketo-5-methylthio-1-phosphopentane phosphatase